MTEAKEKRSESPLSSFFRFKNSSTADEILKILSSHEGVLEDQARKYLNFAHARVKAELFVEAKNFVQTFWVHHPELPFSDLLGLFQMALNDVQHGIIERGNEFIRKRGEDDVQETTE